MIEQINTPSGRRYSTPEGVFPSVTTILSATKSERDKQSLEDWRNRVGIEEANRISKQSTTDGTLFHSCIEGMTSWEHHKMMGAESVYELIKNDTTGANKTRVLNLFDKWREFIHPKVGETYFTEKFGWNSLHKYAGAIDFGGEFDGIPSIVDWKNSTKSKKEEWITDYKLQGAAYTGIVYRCPDFKDVPKIQQFVSVIINDETDEPQVFKYSLNDILKDWWPQWELRCKVYHNQFAA